jgi:osmotically inducible protein OsmC
LDPSIGKITKSELTLTAKVPGISEEEFQKYAKMQKKAVL